MSSRGKAKGRNKPPPPAPRSRFQVYRDNQRGGPPKPLAPHGTMGAVRRHERLHEKLCDPCRLAYNEQQRVLYEAREAKRRAAEEGGAA